MKHFSPMLLLLILALPAWGLDRPPWDKLVTKVGPDAEVPGWYINLGITGARAMITKEDPTVLLVMYVFKDTPAAEKLAKGDKIVGANGRAFVTPHKFGYGMGKFGYEGPMMDFGNALEESQDKLGGKLRLDVVRDDSKITAELLLTTRYGSFGETYPFNCKKSEIILKEACAYLIREQRTDGTWHGRPHINAFASLALLGSGEQEYRPAVRKAMEAMARSLSGKIQYGGLPCWQYGLYGIAMGEYYLATHEAWVLPELEKINKWLSLAQHPATSAPEREHIAGGFGHGPHNPDGRNGYGSFNVVTAQAMMAWALMQRCGLTVDSTRFDAAHEFIARGTNKIGYVWYADGVGGPGYADMGRTGASALAHSLWPAENPGYKAFVLLNAQCIGEHPDTFIDTHGCPLLGMAWSALGAATDPPSLRKLMDANRWAFALSQCPDGTFYYQPNRDNNPQDYSAAPRLAATAATALILTLPKKQLQITGAKPVACQLPGDAPALGTQPKKGPVKIFVLAGQSNMEGQAVVDLAGKNYNEGRGTLAMLMQDPAKRAMFRHLKDAAGKWAVRGDVWVRYQRENKPLLAGPLGLGFSVYGDPHHFGPELQLGHVIGDGMANQVLLVKTAWGGKSLIKDFRPPSSGGTVGPYYTRMIADIRTAMTDVKKDFPSYDGGGCELAGFVWYQGWNDGCDPKHAVPDYEQNLVNLIHDVRKEFNAPKLPVVVGELTGAWVKAQGPWAALRQAQAAAANRPEFRGNVRFVETHDFVRKPEDSPNPGHGHHEFGNAETYFLVGNALGEGMKQLLQEAKTDSGAK